MNRDKVFYVHIPKTGGTFVLNSIFNTNNLKAEHYKLNENENRIILCSIRNPISFYESFYNFFLKPNHKISNSFKNIVKEFNNINEFTINLLNNKNLFNKYNINKYDKFYINSKNTYGLLTNYLLYFLNYKDGNIEDFLKNKIKQIEFIKTENLKDDLVKFCKKYNLDYININKKINKNVQIEKLNEATIDLIKKKDELIFKLFYL